MNSVIKQAKKIVGGLSKRHTISINGSNACLQNRNPFSVAPQVEVSAKFGKFYLEKIANLDSSESKSSNLKSMISLQDLQQHEKGRA